MDLSASPAEESLLVSLRRLLKPGPENGRLLEGCGKYLGIGPLQRPRLVLADGMSSMRNSTLHNEIRNRKTCDARRPLDFGLLLWPETYVDAIARSGFPVRGRCGSGHCPSRHAYGSYSYAF
jgi:hypothetical protein